MGKLKEGDEVCQVIHERWGNGKRFIFAKVVRTTNTQAVLDNGVRLKNDPKKDSYRDYLYFYEIPHSYKSWQLNSDELRREAKVESERRKIEYWFNNKKFTEQEIKIIYDRFVELDLIEIKTDAKL